MDLIVFGANGPTGRLVVARALASGHRVAAVTRRPDQYPLASPQLEVVAADVTDADAVDRAIAARPQAVISTYGVPYSRKEITVYSHGITNVTAAMTRHGVRRLVCVTSTTVGRRNAPGQSLLGRKVLLPLLRHVVGRTLYDDMQRMEEIVHDSDLEWTIVRPGGLFDTAGPTGDYQVGPSPHPGNVTSRADLADALVDEAVQGRYPRATIEVITRSGTPSASTFARQALGLRAQGSRPRSRTAVPGSS